MRSRITIVFVVLALLWISVGLRALRLQVLPNENLSRLRSRQFETVVRLEPRRGDILDRNGKELASSISAYSLFADPKLIQAPRRLSRVLAKSLSSSAKEIYSKIKNPSRRFVWIERRLNSEVKKQIEAWKEPGLGFVEEGKRIYPHEQLLGQTLGFVGREGSGLEGLESRFEKELRGEERHFNVRRDAMGRPLVADGQLFTERPGGANIQLTIDSDIQYFLEQELATVKEQHEAERAMGVVLDAQTSEILAIATDPGFNPNEGSNYDAALRKNAIVADAYEPGSTLKTFTIAAALRAGIVQPSTKYYCEKGRMKVGDKWIKEADTKEKWEWLTVSQILEHSSNIGATKIAFDLGQEKLHQAFLDFGFGDKTGIEIPGETRGILPPLPWRQHHFSNISFGHGISVSPLQIANAYAAIANGGTLHQPRIVKKVINSETEEPFTLEEPKSRQVFTTAEANTLRIMLTGVTSSLGTGSKARVSGFVVAGKTGTAQKVNPDGRGYLKGSYISSFAGFVPANDPKFVIYIAVDSSKKGYYGAEVAAPVFNRVAEYALRSNGILPSIIAANDVIDSKKMSAKTTKKLNEPLKSVPSLKGLTVREVLETVQGQNLRVEMKGRGVVVNTVPAAGEPIDDDHKLLIFFSRASSE
jgi:cell division protein FtsI (penicillin-binding protein 3)